MLLQRPFIVCETGLSEADVRAMQDVEREHQIRAGILVQVFCDDD